MGRTLCAPRIDSFHDLVWILGTNHALGNFRGQCFWAGIYNLHQFTMMQWHLPHVFVLGPSARFKPMIHWSSHRAAPTPHPKGLGHQTASEKTLLRSKGMDVKGCQGMSGGASLAALNSVTNKIL